MNLLVSYDWLKEFVKTHDGPERLARLLSLSGPNVERMKKMSEFWEGMVVGKVLASEKHPNADRLTVNKVDVGEKTVQIICGAPNVRVGMLAVVALPGAKVRWHGEGELVTLAATKIRGVESFGMMCAGGEIGLEKYPGDGIMDISFSDAKPGVSLAKALDMDDTIFDVEITSNRPDAMSVVGIAREAAVITKSKFLYKENTLSLERSRELPLPLSVRVDERKLCPRFSGIVVDGVRVCPSPWWMQKRLLMAGLRPINNIVDITNYVMLEQGKPLHAFDANSLHNAPTSPSHKSPLLPPFLKGDRGGFEGEVHLVVRRARKGERLQALDGKTYELTDSMLVIADEEKPVAIAGVMGGQESGVTEKTTRIIFESAVFDPVSIRRTARALNLHSEASNLFEKGLAIESTLPALARAVELTLKIAGGHVASKLADVATKQPKSKPITLDGATVKRFLGIDLPQKEVNRILESLGFDTTVKKCRIHVSCFMLHVVAPWWRPDVTMDQDLVEEIGRIYGYHRLPATLPTGELPIQSPDERKEFFWERRVKELLRGAGFTETMSYSFTSEQELKKLGLDPMQSFRVTNPLSDDQAYLRPRPIPALLSIAAANQNERAQLRIFELAKMFRHGKGALPEEPLRLAGAVVSLEPFREAKGAIVSVLERAGIMGERLQFVPYAAADHYALWVDRAKSVAVIVDGQKMGSVVMLTQKALHDFDIKKPIAFFRLRFQELVRKMSEVKHYTPLPKYPPVLRDLAFVFPKAVAYADVAAALHNNPLVVSIELFDLYEGTQVGEGKKSMAFHVRYSAPDRTLTNEEVERVEATIVKEVEKKFNAKLRDL